MVINAKQKLLESWHPLSSSLMKPLNHFYYLAVGECGFGKGPTI
jgi:hypothetical protein